jgi:hypothetical protein
MIRERWLQALSIDLQTGLDPPGFKVRAAQGLDAAVRSFECISLIGSPSLFKGIGSGKRLSRTWLLLDMIPIQWIWLLMIGTSPSFPG